MNDGRIATRYAKALLEWSGSRGESGSLYTAATKLSPVLLEHSAELNHILGSVVIPQSKKEDFSARFFKGNAAGLHDLAKLMIKKGRGAYIVRAILVFTELYRKQQGIVHVEVRSAHELGANQYSRLKEYLQAHYGERIDLQPHEDLSLIGGFQLYVQGKRYDKSVRGELLRLAHAMRD